MWGALSGIKTGDSRAFITPVYTVTTLNGNPGLKSFYPAVKTHCYDARNYLSLMESSSEDKKSSLDLIPQKS